VSASGDYTVLFDSIYLGRVTLLLAFVAFGQRSGDERQFRTALVIKF